MGGEWDANSLSRQCVGKEMVWKTVCARFRQRAVVGQVLIMWVVYLGGRETLVLQYVERNVEEKLQNRWAWDRLNLKPGYKGYGKVRARWLLE